MNEQLLNQLKQKHTFESWNGINALPEALFIWRFFLSGNEFPDWQAHRIQTSALPEGIQYTESIWERPDTAEEQLLRVEVFECESRLAAHAYLLQLLGEFMSPLLTRQEEIGIGDVAFVMPEGMMILFARANLVIKFGNAGADLVLVNEIAHRFDQELINRPEQTSLRVITHIETTAPSDISPPTLVPVVVEPIGTAPAKRWHKFFSQSGEIYRDGEQLIYESASIDPHEVTVYSINPLQKPTN